jgi:hypothetical protein
VHDLFEILGLPTNAPARDVRRACARRPRSLHPDFRNVGALDAQREALLSGRSPGDDLAVDFVEASTFTDRMQSAFFNDGVRP